MPFSEALRKKIRKQCLNQCCICHHAGVEIHHVIPQQEGGPDVYDNAAPLCPTCHSTYGANPEKRKFIRESRDAWYEICEHKIGPSIRAFEKIMEKINNIPTFNDLENLYSEMLPNRNKCAVATKPSRLEDTLKFADILHAIYDSEWQNHGVTAPAVQILFIAAFDLKESIWDDESQELFNQCIDMYGKQTARELCGYALKHDGSGRTNGLKPEEILSAIKYIWVILMLLTRHYEIVSHEPAFAATTAPNGEFLLYTVEFDDEVPILITHPTN